MSFAQVIGQEIPKKALQAALKQDRLAHAYLFHGPDGVGKEFCALQLAKAVNCQRLTEDACDECSSCEKIDHLNHPDVSLVFPTPDPKKTPIEEIQRKFEEKRANPHRRIQFPRAASIHIDDIRALQEKLAYAPYEGRKKIAILLDADQMPVQAGNAFLKLLEEPSGNALLILVSTRSSSLLPTILSRCQQLRFTGLRDEDIAQALVASGVVGESRAGLFALLAEGSLGRAREMAEEDLLKHRERALDLWQRARSEDRLLILNGIEDLARTRDRATMATVLDFLFFWVQDLLAVKTQAAHRIRNTDLRGRLETEARSQSIGAILGAIKALEEARQSILVANVDPQLALIYLCSRLGLEGQGQG